MTIPNLSRRLVLLAATLLAIASGSALRLTRIGLPWWVVKYGGAVIWGAMVYCLVAFVMAGARRRSVAMIALALALASELFRLHHTPWLDEFRLTLAGQLLLGRIFSMWNVLAYAAGIGIAASIDQVLTKRSGS